MILSTTPQIEGHTIREYKGVVTGETIIGANFVFCRHPRHRRWSCWQLRESACRGQGYLHAGDDAACPGHGSQCHRRHRHRLRDHRCQRVDAYGSHKWHSCSYLKQVDGGTPHLCYEPTISILSDSHQYRNFPRLWH